MIPEVNIFAFSIYVLKTGQFCASDRRRCLHSCNLLLKESIAQEITKRVYQFFILYYSGIIQLLQLYCCRTITGTKLT